MSDQTTPGGESLKPRPWSGVTFACAHCEVPLQLEDADECALRRVFAEEDEYETPACPQCGGLSLVTVRRPNNEEVVGA